ncbi:flagellar hook-length control protein FliK [Zobellella sp. An-6]|uniref:flagellar hook-length control protein FliK n=1 Tax=Zobellella sp. An-6 TaxID=3400218 RepID=UPI0040426FEE
MSDPGEAPASARAGEEGKARPEEHIDGQSEEQAEVQPEGQPFRAELAAIAPPRGEPGASLTGALKTQAPEPPAAEAVEPRSSQGVDHGAAGTTAAATADAGTAAAEEGDAPVQPGALPQARRTAPEQPFPEESPSADGAGQEKHAGQPVFQAEASGREMAGKGERPLAPEAVEHARSNGAPGTQPDRKDALWQADVQPDRRESTLPEGGAEPDEVAKTGAPVERREARWQAGPAPVVSPDTSVAPANETGYRAAAGVNVSAAGQAQWSLARPPVAAEGDEATPDWLAQIEHGRRWQQASESGNKLPPEPAAATTLDLTGAEDGREPAGLPEMPGAEVEPDKAVPPVTVGKGETLPPPVADDRVTIPETVAPAVAGSREGSPLLSPERGGLTERPLALQGTPEQGARQLAQQVQVMVSQNLQEADIRLSPSELGGLRIQLKFEQGEVNVQFLASQPQARELLDQALPRLREMLVQQGLTLGQGTVGGFGGQQGAQQQAASEGGGRGGHSSAPAESQDMLEPGEMAAKGSGPVPDGRIDFFA